MTALSETLAHAKPWLRFAGGLAIIIAGARIALGARRRVPTEEQTSRRRGCFASAFLLTVSNPTLFITLTALVAALGLQTVRGNYTAASLSLACIFVGSAAWWVIITGLVNQLHSRLTDSTIAKVDRFAGAAIAALGLGILLS
jgi:threonine/homoserine/homoserine lactone efflux protein